MYCYLYWKLQNINEKNQMRPIELYIYPVFKILVRNHFSLDWTIDSIQSQLNYNKKFWGAVIDKIILKFMLNSKLARTPRTILRIEKVRGVTPSDFETYYHISVIKTV